MFAKQAQTAPTGVPDTLVDDTAVVPTTGQATALLTATEVAAESTEAALLNLSKAATNEKEARQQKHQEEASIARKRKAPPNESARLPEEADTPEYEDGKPAAEEEFTLPPGAVFQAPATTQDEEEPSSGLTFQQMWEEVIAKAPDERVKLWTTAITELNKAIVSGDANVIRQTVITWRVESYGTNFAVAYRDADGTIQVLHALDAVQAGVLGFWGGIPNTTTAKVVAIPVEKWGLIEMYPATAMQAKKTTTTTFKKGDRKTPIPNVRALNHEQLEMMLGTSKTAGEWYRIVEDKTRQQRRVSRADTQFMQFLRAAATDTPNQDHPLTLEVEEITADTDMTKAYKTTAYQRFYGRAMDGASISTRTAAAAFEQWSFQTGGTQATPRATAITAQIPRNPPTQVMRPPERVEYATQNQTQQLCEQQPGLIITGQQQNPFQQQQPETQITGEQQHPANPFQQPETQMTGDPQQNPTRTGATTETQNPTITGHPTRTGAQTSTHPTITGPQTTPYPTITGTGTAMTAAMTHPTNTGAPPETRLTTHQGTTMATNTTTHMGAPTNNQTTQNGAPQGQIIPYTTPPTAQTQAMQQTPHTGTHQGQIVTTTPTNYQTQATPTPQMQLGFGQNPFQTQQTTTNQHGGLPTQPPPAQQQQQGPNQHQHPTVLAINQMYAIINKPIGTHMTTADWQRIDQLRAFPGLAHLPHQPQQQQPQMGFQYPHAQQMGGLYQQQQPKGLPEDDIARLCAIGNLQPHETHLLNPIWHRVAKGSTKARKKQLVRNWWTGLRAQNPVLPAEPTPDIFSAIIDMNFASDVQAPKANGLYPAMLLSVSAAENYEQNLVLHNQDRATFITADDLSKQMGRDFS